MEYKRKSRRGLLKLSPRQTMTLIFLAALVFFCVLYALYLGTRPALAR